MDVRGNAVAGTHAAEARVSRDVDVRQLVITWIDAVDLVHERGREAKAGEIEILLISVVSGDEARQRIAGVDEVPRRKRIDVVDRESPVIAEEVVADRAVVA